MIVAVLVVFLSTYLSFVVVFMTPVKRILVPYVISEAMRHVDIKALFLERMEKVGFDQQVEKLLDKKIDDLVEVFRQQIPMGSSFLVGSIVERFKSKAMAEIMTMLPSVKDKIISGAFDKAALVGELAAKVVGVNVAIFHKVGLAFAVLAAVISLCIYGVMVFLSSLTAYASG